MTKKDSELCEPARNALKEHLARVEEATKAEALARTRHAFAADVQHEHQAAMLRLREVLSDAPAECGPIAQRLRAALAPAAEELSAIVQDELELLVDAERQLARAHEMLRQAERDLSNTNGR